MKATSTREDSHKEKKLSLKWPYLSSLVINHLLGCQVGLVAHKQLVHILTCIAVNLIQPLFHIVEALLISYIVHNLWKANSNSVIHSNKINQGNYDMSVIHSPKQANTNYRPSGNQQRIKASTILRKDSPIKTDNMCAVYYNDAMSTPVITARDGPESLLSSCVPLQQQLQYSQSSAVVQ